MNRRQLLQFGAGASAVALLPRSVAAQAAYPDRVVKLIVPRPAGGVVDVIAREWSEKVNKTLGSTFIENIGGGGGVIGAVAAARAPADGYTLLLGTTSELVISPMLAHQSYDPIASFEPIAIICDSAAAIVVNPSVPATNLKELVAYARNNRDKLNYASAGAGTVSNLAGELFKRADRLAGHHAHSIQGRRSGGVRRDRRSGAHRDADDVRANFRVAPPRQAQDSRRRFGKAPRGDARHCHRGRARLSRLRRPALCSACLRRPRRRSRSSPRSSRPRSLRCRTPRCKKASRLAASRC